MKIPNTQSVRPCHIFLINEKWIEITREQGSVIWAQEPDGVMTDQRKQVSSMEVPDHHSLSRNFSIDKPTALPILCRAIPPITTQAALAKAGLGEQDGVWVSLDYLKQACTMPAPLVQTLRS